MSARRDFECGCRWRKADGNWWQTVACPLHEMDMLPKTEPFMVERKPMSLLEASHRINRRLADAAEAGLSVREAVAALAREAVVPP